MKNLVILLTFFNIYSFSYSQSNNYYKVYYEKYFDINQEKFSEYFSNVQNKDVVNRNKEVFTEIEEFKLLFNENESIFSKIAKLNNSQTMKDVIEANGDRIVFNNSSGLRLYRNILQNFTLIPSENNYNIQDSLYNFNWEINYPETKEILGYKVNKATAKGLENDTTIIAWYTTELPYQQGPYLYWGLPGLILKIDVIVNDNFGLAYFINSYHFEAKKIEPLNLKSTESFEKIKKMRRMEKTEYEKKKELQESKVKEYNNQGVDKE